MRSFVVVEDAIANPAKIIENSLALASPQPSLVGSGAHVRDIRDVRQVRLQYDRGIGATMAGIGLAANAAEWRFDVTHVNQCDFLAYDKEGHYEQHIDLVLDAETRKLSVLAFLNDAFEGGRFFLHCEEGKIYPVQKPGTVIVFPSFFLHGVEPVKSGTRYSLITWMVGPWLR